MRRGWSRLSSPGRLQLRPNRYPEHRRPRPAAAGSQRAPTRAGMEVPIPMEAFERALTKEHPAPLGRAGPRYWQQWADYRLAAELNPMSKRLTGTGTITLLQPLARHPRGRLRPATPQHFRAGRPPQHRRPLGGRGRRAHPGCGPGPDPGARQGRGPRIPGGRDDHADPAAQAAPARRHGRPRLRLAASGSRPTARLAVARTARSTTSATGIPRSRSTTTSTAGRSIPYSGQRRVLHGLRRLRRGPDRARRAGWSAPPARCRTPTEVLGRQTRARLARPCTAAAWSCTW